MSFRACPFPLAFFALIWAASATAGTLPALTCAHTGSGTLYDVGPDRPYTSIGAVPWELLQAGDAVRIHARPSPYREKILLRRQGTAEQPIMVCGVPDSNGAPPILDGENATTRASMGYRVQATEPRGLIHVSWGAGDAWGFKPRHLVIQGLHIRNAFHEHGFTSASGAALTYNANAAGLFIERGEHITVRDVTLSGNGNGFFVASGDSEEVLSRDIVLERSRLHGNGTVTVSNDRHHNLYTEAVGMTIQYNQFGPLRAGSGGGNLKDRSAGTVVRYNWIEGGARSIDLVEAQDSWPMVQALPEYRRSLVYGNVIISGPGGSGPTYLIHYGGDSGLFNTYRKGMLYFYNNTVVVRSNQTGANSRWRTVLFDVSSQDETVDARNNVVFVRALTPGQNPTDLSWMHAHGVLNLEVNWASHTLSQWRDNATPTGIITGLANVLGNPDNDPGWIDETGDDFSLLDDSQAADAGVALHETPLALGYLVSEQYLPHAAGQIRPDDGALDLGAFEYVGDAIFANGFEER